MATSGIAWPRPGVRVGSNFKAPLVFHSANNGSPVLRIDSAATMKRNENQHHGFRSSVSSLSLSSLSLSSSSSSSSTLGWGSVEGRKAYTDLRALEEEPRRVIPTVILPRTLSSSHEADDSWGYFVDTFDERGTTDKHMW